MWLSAPDADDSGSVAVIVNWTVVDDDKGLPVRGLTVGAPFGWSVIDLPRVVSVADGMLDIAVGEATFAEADLGVIGPDEVLNRHCRASLRSGFGVW